MHTAMPSIDPKWFFLLIGAAIVAVASAYFALSVQRRWKRFHMRRRFARGRVGEQQAVSLLRRHGYEVLDEQLQKTTGLWVDGQWQEVVVRADLLAAKAGRTYVVEVKTGSKAPDPTSTATRRQLFEYTQVYEADGLILADMERGTLLHIRFPDTPHSVRSRVHGFGWPAVVAGSVAGLLLGGLLAASMLR